MGIKQFVSSYFTGSPKRFSNSKGLNDGYCKLSTDITAEPEPRNEKTDENSTSRTLESTQNNESQNDELGKLIDDIENRMNKIKSFDQISEINLYCNDIQREVNKAVQDGIEHLRNVEKKLTAQIDDYRSSQIRACSFNHPSAVETFLDTDMDLNNSMNEINNLVNSYSTFLKKIKIELQYEEEKSAIMTQARICLPKVKEMRRNLRKDAFRGKFMIFTPSSYFASNDQIGILTTIEEDTVILDEDLKNFKLIPKQVFLPNNQSGVGRLYFLDDGKVAIVSQGKRLSVCELENGNLISSLKCEHEITALADLSDGNIAIGLTNGAIQVWNQTTNVSKMFKVDEFWSGEIFSLKRLTDENIASVTLHKVRIWNIRLDNSVACQAESSLTQRVPPRGWPKKLDLVSDGNLITCRNFHFCGSAVFILHSNNAKLLQYMETTLDDVSDFKVLKNDLLVLGSNTIIQLYDLKKNALLRTLYEDYSTGKELRLSLLSIGLIISYYESKLCIICPKSGKKLEYKISTNNYNWIQKIFYFEDTKLLAVEQSDKITILMLNNEN